MSQIEVLTYTMDNPQVLLDLYKDFREVDRELDIECEVRYVVSIYAGERSGSRAIVYSYPDEAHAWDAQMKRQANPRFQELGQKLNDAGFTLVERSLLNDITPS